MVDLNFIRDRRTGAYRIPTGNNAHKRTTDKPCPDYLLKKFRRFAPVYKYSNGPSTATLSKVEWWRDTGEWVGIYTIKWYRDGTTDKGTDRFVFACRNGVMTEVRQLIVDGPWKMRVWQ